MSLDFHPLVVREVRPDTDEAMIVSFDVPSELRDTFRFVPGQHLTLRSMVDGADLRRSYSICAGAAEPALQVGIRRVPGGAFSSWVADRLKAGDRIDVFPPQGHFSVPAREGRARHVLGIAGGSGITPILSIMKSLLADEPDSRFTLIYGNRHQRSTMFLEELEDLKNRHLSRLALHHVFSREHTDRALGSGRLDREKIGQFLETLIDVDDLDHAFICGPHGVNEEAMAALLAAGMPAARIHVERFGAPPLGASPLGAPPLSSDASAAPARQPGDARFAEVVIVRDGLSRAIGFQEGDQSILDAAARAGLEVPYSCKSGVCSTCRARLKEGQVRMERNFALEPHEVEAGFVLTCQSHPLTPRVVLSFDER